MNDVKRRTLLSENIIAFCRYLRNNGFEISPDHEIDAFHSIGQESISSREELCLLLKLTLSKNKKQFLTFDQHFEQYWKLLSQAVDAKVKQSAEQSKVQKPKQKPSLNALKNWLNGNRSEEVNEVALYSSHHKLLTEDFSSFSDEELWEIKKELKKITKSLVNKKLRRFESTHQHRQLAIRKVMRNNLRRGGEVLDLYYQQRKESKLNLVMMCDVSRSMSLYSRFLIQFLHAFQTEFKSIETFVFSAKITRVTNELKHHRYEETLKTLIQNLTHWGDGTRIGECLVQFESVYSRKLIDNQTILVLVSDGLDTDNLEVLDQVLYRLYHSAAKIVWLNPLAGAKSFKAEVGGMKTALPYIDVLAPIHNLKSLKNLPKYLSSKRRRKRIRSFTN